LHPSPWITFQITFQIAFSRSLTVRIAMGFGSSSAVIDFLPVTIYRRLLQMPLEAVLLVTDPYSNIYSGFSHSLSQKKRYTEKFRQRGLKVQHKSLQVGKCRGTLVDIHELAIIDYSRGRNAEAAKAMRETEFQFTECSGNR
jgi:hypothetical protein